MGNPVPLHAGHLSSFSFAVGCFIKSLRARGVGSRGIRSLAGALPAVQYAVEFKHENRKSHVLKMHQLASNRRRAGRSQRIGLALKPFGDAGNNVVLGFALPPGYSRSISQRQFLELSASCRPHNRLHFSRKSLRRASSTMWSADKIALTRSDCGAV